MNPATARLRPEQRGEFKNIGEFFQHVHAIDSLKQPPSFIGQGRILERTGQEGGHAIPTSFMENIKILHLSTSLMARCDIQRSASSYGWFPIDSNAPWNNGIQAKFIREGEPLFKSSPSLTGQFRELDKLSCYVEASSEVIEDAPRLEDYMNSKLPDAVNSEANRALISGRGQGEPFGVIHAPGRVVVSKTSGQPAGTFTGANASEMVARLDPEAQSPVWIFSPRLWPQVHAAVRRIPNDAATETVAAVPLYSPVVDPEAPYGRLAGIPCLPTDWCPSPGAEGDIALVDWNRYLVVRHAIEPTVELSMHVLFDRDAGAFRFIFRVSGAPWDAEPKPRTDGGNDPLGAIVVLEERA